MAAAQASVALAAAGFLRRDLPDARIRFVNVVDDLAVLDDHDEAGRGRVTPH
ncbi:hypothetical protein ACFVX6_16095 [Streptomyces sp. NPDC058289]|uniref:phosphoketolase family protein n=1 Tax=Streptomyces sp. NPDC058289 TaxID=3346425 RepID=UPI0036E719A2